MVMRNFKFLLLTVILAAFAGGTLISTSANAQTAVKPKLVPITLDETTNDPKALIIARKLDPDFFQIDPDYLDGGKNAKFYAKFLPLDNKNPNRFLIITVTDALYYCTKYGCPFKIFERLDNNKWNIALNFQGYTLWYDANTAGEKPDNIIGEGFDPVNGSKPGVWMWYGKGYQQLKR